MPFPAGAKVRLDAAFFTDSTGQAVIVKVAENHAPAAPAAFQAVAPGTVTLHYGNPSGTTTSWTVTSGQIVNSQVGYYYADVDTTAAPGRWSYRWLGTGANQGYADGAFDVTDDTL